MTTFTKTIIDVATGESKVIPFTEEETKVHLAMQQKIADAEAAVIAEEQAKSNAKQSLLDKLGINEEEAKLLLS